MKATLLLFSFLLFASLLLAQSPWTRSKAGFYTQAAWQFIPTYDAIFDKNFPDDTRNLEREITENAVQFYGEYGITSKTTVWAAVPFRFMKSGDNVGGGPNPPVTAGTLSGFGNVTVAVRQNFLSKNLTFSGQLRVDLPVSKFDQPTGLSTGYDALTLLSTLSVGKGYGKYYWFAYGGWGGRGVWKNNFINIGAEGGAKLGKCWLIGFSELWQDIGSEIYAAPPSNEITGLFLPNPSYWSFGAKGIYEFNRFWGALVTVAGAFQGDLVPQRPAFSLGAYFKWD
jgi:hypothetical protein